MGHRWSRSECRIRIAISRYPYLVRVLARESNDGRGARSAEYTCVALYTIAGWLRQEQLIPETAGLPSFLETAWPKAEMAASSVMDGM